MYMLKIDKELAVPNRSLRAYNEKLLFAPTGDRLFCDCLVKQPGFCGHIDFIHKMNIDQLFTVKCSTNPDFITAQTMWYPSRLTMEFEDEDIRFEEVKMITQDDIAFVAQTWENHSMEPVTLTLEVAPSLCIVEANRDQDYIWMQMKEERNTIQVGAAIRWDASEDDTLVLQPGETVSFTVAAATGDLPLENRDVIVERLHTFYRENLTPEERVDNNAKEFEKFFDSLPTFESSDPILDKTWLYRWYILNHCTTKPRHGFLQHTTVYEGRAHKTGKLEPMKVTGWEFSRLIILSSPLQMMDYKWCPDKEKIHDIVRGFFDTADENGICQSTFVHHKGSPFANFMIWSVYQMYLVDGDKEFIKEMLPKMKKCLDANTRIYGADNDNLQIEVKHQRTGKEFQPSYWYFNHFPKNGRDKSLVTPLKRLDTSIYHYLNTVGLYKMMDAVQEGDTKEYKEFAATLARQINEKTWDESTRFYYDLHFETDEKAMVKNIVGIYPYWAQIADEDKLDGMDYLFDKEHFNTGSVFSTVSKECVAFSPAGGWMGVLHSRDGCMWDGPSWPYTNGITLDTIGKQSKLHGHKFDDRFAEFLRKYSLQHYRMHDINQPYLVEQYHAVTDEALSDEPDYNHSYYLELLIEHVAGLSVQEDKIVIDPLQIGLKYFKLDNILVRGKKLTICYSNKERKAKNLKAGFFLYVDGNIAAQFEELQKIEIEL